MRALRQILRVDDQLIETVSNHKKMGRTIATCLAITCVGAAFYGLAFGIWRSPLQACYSTAKMPLLFLSTVAISGTANTVLSQVLGAGLSFRQVFLCIAICMAIAAALLGALSPVALFFSAQYPATVETYPWVLICHTGIIGICGTVGVVHLHGLLRALTAVPYRVMTAWFLVSGFVGCQLSWILSPFLAMPDRPVPFLNPAAFSGNVYEYLWHTLVGRI